MRVKKDKLSSFGLVIKSLLSSHKILASLIFSFGLLATLTMTILISYQLIFLNKIHLGVKVANINVSGLQKNQALLLIYQKVITSNKEIELKFEHSTFQFNQEILNPNYNVAEVVNKAFTITRSGNWLENLKWQYLALTGKVNLPLELSLNDEYLNDKLARVAALINLEPIPPEVKLSDNKIEVSRGKLGKKVNHDKVRELILKQFTELSVTPILLPVENTGIQLDEDQIEIITKQAENFIGKEINLEFGSNSWQFNDSVIISLLDIKPTKDNTQLALVPNRSKIANIIEGVKKEINRPAKNARFQFENGRVTIFEPALTGQELETEKSINLFNQAIISQEKKTKISLPVVTQQPEIQTSEVNNLGINELIGSGFSSFEGSSRERIHNIQLASSRINGILLAPGEIFSFNNTIGEISVSTGYTTAYIISKGRTILGEGGGVCQVSTTLFRAAVNAGLPIIERHPHAYRVSYYEKGGSKPGLDATIFVPTVDLRFENDTPAYILIQGYIKDNYLYFDIYGTKDGRKVTVSEPKISNIVPPPPPIYEEDPELPKGVVKQVDFPATGAKIRVTRTVEKNGNIKTDVFNSDYKPWQAVYKVGTKGIQ